MKIRPANIQDVPTIAQLNTTVQSLHHEIQPSRYKKPVEDSPTLRRLYEQWLQRKDCVAFIAEIDKQIVGYIICFIQNPSDNPFVYPVKTLHVDQISVEPTYQRQGIGRELIQIAREAAKEQGATDITFGVHVGNEKAQAFFKSLGFTPASLRMHAKL